ncbi:MAG: hypothetical protein BWY96_03174 [Spirochaetes bacterium ADurb.BinA120]|nr:MAG: hypothetical protein BWY96_03174 [Spirochaetes bacterium ADurb.BinA120]
MVTLPSAEMSARSPAVMVLPIIFVSFPEWEAYFSLASTADPLTVLS